RARVLDSGTRSPILVIGEPLCPPTYPRLAGAWQEAKSVAGRLEKPHDVRLLLSDDVSQPGPDALTVVNALHERDWRVVHIAGHGAPAVEVDGTLEARG